MPAASGLGWRMGSSASASHVAHTHAYADADADAHADADAQVQAMAQRTRRRREDRTKAPFTHCSRTASCCTSLLKPRGLLLLLLPGARSRSRFQSAANTAPVMQQKAMTADSVLQRREATIHITCCRGRGAREGFQNFRLGVWHVELGHGHRNDAAVGWVAKL